MPSGQPTPAARAIGYAEETLKVHVIFNTTVHAKEKLDDILGEVAKLRDQRREAEEALRDREMEIALEAWSSDPTASATKIDGVIKTAKQSDTFHRALRGKIGQINSDIEGLEYDKAILEAEIKIGVARMHELGGYLTYLAAVRVANTTEKPEKPE